MVSAILLSDHMSHGDLGMVDRLLSPMCLFCLLKICEVKRTCSRWGPMGIFACNSRWSITKKLLMTATFISAGLECTIMQSNLTSKLEIKRVAKMQTEEFVQRQTILIPKFLIFYAVSSSLLHYLDDYLAIFQWQANLILPLKHPAILFAIHILKGLKNDRFISSVCGTATMNQGGICLPSLLPIRMDVVFNNPIMFLTLMSTSALDCRKMQVTGKERIKFLFKQRSIVSEREIRARIVKCSAAYRVQMFAEKKKLLLPHILPNKQTPMTSNILLGIFQTRIRAYSTSVF